MGKGTHLTDTDRAEIWDLYAQGLNTHEIHLQVGRSYWTVEKVFRSSGGIRPQPRTRSTRSLTLEEREEISLGVRAKETFATIAERIGRSTSTVSREVARNGGRATYRATRADKAAAERLRRPKSPKLAHVDNGELEAVVAAKLGLRWSPQQISKWLQTEYPDDPTMRVSHETIYASIYRHGLQASPPLELPVRGLRLQVPHDGGPGDGPCGSSRNNRRAITMTTPAEIIYHRRVRLLDLARELNNISEACRQLGISRTRYYEWKDIAERYGVEALWPKDRRRPALPNETPTHVVADLFALVIIEPTIGCRQYADRLAELGFTISKSTVQKILVDHQLGRRRQRVARAAAVALLSGLATDTVTEDVVSPFGFCHWAGAPGDLMALDSFYIGNLKGVGKVYQLTAVDTCTRWAIVRLIIGPVTAADTIRFIDHVTKTMRRLGIPVRRVLTDNGPEYIARPFQEHLADISIGHVRIPPRSPNHNAVCERFQGTMLQECWRPAFHRRHFTSIRQLQLEANAWLVRYNTRRRNHGDYMAGRRPIDILNSHTTKQAA